MTLNIILAMLPVEMILALELTTNQNVNVKKGPCLEFVSIVLIDSLTVRQPMVRFTFFSEFLVLPKFRSLPVSLGIYD